MRQQNQEKFFTGSNLTQTAESKQGETVKWNWKYKQDKLN